LFRLTKNENSAELKILFHTSMVDFICVACEIKQRLLFCLLAFWRSRCG